MHELRTEAGVSAYAIFIVTIIYGATAVREAQVANYGVAVFLGGCAVANVGIMMMAKG